LARKEDFKNLSGSRSKSLKAAGEPRAPLVFCARHVLAVSAQCSLQSFPAPPLRFLHFSWVEIIKSQKMFCFYVRQSAAGICSAPQIFTFFVRGNYKIAKIVLVFMWRNPQNTQKSLRSRKHVLAKMHVPLFHFMPRIKCGAEKQGRLH